MDCKHIVGFRTGRITLEEAAARLGVPEATLCQWIAQGYLDAYPAEVVTCAPSQTADEDQSGVVHSRVPASVSVQEGALYLDAEQVEELAERIEWSRLGRKSWMRDEKE